MIAQMPKILRGPFFTLVLILIANLEAIAQCPMCRMSLESNLKNGGTAGQGMNAGILMLLSTPYLLVGGIAYVWFRNRKTQQDSVDLAYEES
jgi:hypothetical protein